VSFVHAAREALSVLVPRHWQQAWFQGCCDPLCSLLESMKVVLVVGRANTGSRKSILCSSQSTWRMASCQSIVLSLPAKQHKQDARMLILVTRQRAIPYRRRKP
jgi:hypothetical protein